MATIQGAYEEMVVGILDCVLYHNIGHSATHVRHSTPTSSKWFMLKDDSLYVGIPHFASKYINDYKYDTEGLEITNPRPNAFHVKQKKSLSMGGGFSGSGYLTAFNASIRTTNTNEEFAIFPVPQIDFSDGATVEFDTDLDLTCVECLSKIAVQAATDKNFAILATAHPDLKLSGLPTAHLDIHKTMDMEGYNVTGMCCMPFMLWRCIADLLEFVNEQGSFNVTSLELLDPPVDGYNFNATISVRNPTPFSVEMVRTRCINSQLTSQLTRLGSCHL